MVRSAFIMAASTFVVATVAASSAYCGTYFGHPNGAISGGFRWDAAPRVIGGNERSLVGGLRYSLQGGSFAAFRDLIPWNGTPPTVTEFQQAVQHAFAAWESTDPITGLSTSIQFVSDFATPVAGSGNFEDLDPNGAEVDLLVVDGGITSNRARTFFNGVSHCTQRINRL